MFLFSIKIVILSLLLFSIHAWASARLISGNPSTPTLILFSLSLIGVMGVLGWLLITCQTVHDSLTRRTQQLQDALFEAKRAANARDTFIATISHELRTPLTPILALVSAYLTLPSKMTADVYDVFSNVKEKLLLEMRLIDDLVYVQQVLHNKLRYKFDVVNIHLLLLKCLAQPFGERQHPLEIVSHLDAANCYVEGDKERLTQVFSHLLTNASKFTPQVGTLTVSTWNTGSELIVAFQDTGIGIEECFLQAIFEPFVQGGEEVMRKFGGLGLGLALCNSILTSHGGSIHAKSQGSGSGSLFCVRLKSIPIPEPTQMVIPSQIRIMFVEDNKDTARVYIKLFEQLGGFIVHHAFTVKEACELADRLNGEVDILICDIGLPDGNGRDVMRYVRERWKHIPGIAHSGWHNDDDVQNSLDAGFLSHIPKPIEWPTFEAAIRQAVQKK